MKRILVSWIGRSDLLAVEESDSIGLGPIAQAVDGTGYDDIVLISDYPEQEVTCYLGWLATRTPTKITRHVARLTSPTNFTEIYEAAIAAVSETQKRYNNDTLITYHLSPGTPAMAAVWILLAKTLYPATLIQSSREYGVQVADIPFDISAEFIPRIARQIDERLEKLLAALPPEATEFDSIIHRNPVMQRLIAKARLAAIRSVPVLIEGESGTGKELLARAIHRAGIRAEKPFVAVNCGAIPSELVESEFFGHKKGAFTGAASDRKGYFESANSGTLFLDEIGELPLSAQVKILRVLQEGEVTRVGDARPIKLDVRIVAATNRSMMQEVAAGRFRADLFYRLAVAVLFIPPLRERQGDIGLLIDHFLEQAVIENCETRKKISASARNLLLCHPWPGNVRELLNTLRRATVWTTGDTIQADDIREALFPVALQRAEHILGRSIAEGFNIQGVIAEIARHYLQRGMDEGGGNKSKAAKILGLPNYQTLSNWLKKYGLE
ncbi:sigma-54 interaction domain-containing protein [Geotalea uraniireducens]|uniref:Sigma-54 specific transcriptional regulator, Fis family n=1 Tax=Geotalea uraniireducens (strain Rf4) TaxID=351605 RepID=A5GB16_GEOUR|nr:sigma-54 dependent transcriptional regulator [Geotalea uraniireducens]ABQ25230.1 sigma-54 specific transcriptional regulator, Fis family [Geotalea uraniireducens Rf4]